MKGILAKLVSERMLQVGHSEESDLKFYYISYHVTKLFRYFYRKICESFFSFQCRNYSILCDTNWKKSGRELKWLRTKIHIPITFAPHAKKSLLTSTFSMLLSCKTIPVGFSAPLAKFALKILPTLKRLVWKSFRGTCSLYTNFYRRLRAWSWFPVFDLLNPQTHRGSKGES